MLEILMYCYIFALGSIIGSFLNVLIYRFPKNITVVKGFSHCTDCDTQLKAKDLVPIFSFLFLKGKCRYCGSHISYRYPLIETLTALGFTFSFYHFGLSIEFVINALLLADLIVITMIDIDTMEILNRTNLFLVALAIVSMLFGNVIISDRIIGMLIISVPLLLIGYLTKGGFGGGDVRLMACAGFLLGTKSIIVAAFIGIIAGGIFACFLMAKKKKSGKAQMPFGPFLAVGIYTASLYGPQIANWYLSILGR
ncbi:MAG: prepilin peptidase [Erysipelotrichaceae bacterium]